MFSHERHADGSGEETTVHKLAFVLLALVLAGGTMLMPFALLQLS